MTEEIILGEPEILELELMHMVGLKNYYGPNEVVNAVQQWKEFKPKVIEVHNRFGHTDYGIIVDRSDDGGMHYMTAVEVSNFDDMPPPPFEGLRVEPQTYARFIHPHRYETVYQSWDFILNEYFQTHPEKILRGVPMFERYGEGFSEELNDVTIELFVPLQ